MNEYFSSDKLVLHGIPSMKQLGEELNMSGHYLSDLLKRETGKTSKEHINLKLMNKAKNQLLNSNTSIKLLAYELGFESPQYFSKLFKKKTGFSPSEYRVIN